MSQLLRPNTGGSNPNTPVPALFTPARMRITIDPVTGNDFGPFVVANETLIAPDGVTSINYGDTYYLTAATINGAVDRIPVVVRFPVFLDLPAGTTTATDGGNVLGPELDFNRFIITGDVRIIDAINGYLDAAAGIYLNGQQTITLAKTLATIHTAFTIGAAIVMGVDAHRGAIVEITDGTGRGQWRRVLRNSATTIQVADSFAPTPDATSEFQVWRPGANLEATINVSVGNNIGFGGIVFAPDVSLNQDGGTGFPLNIQEGGLVVFGATISDGGTGNRSITMVGGTFSTSWLDLARDPFFQRIVGPFFGSGLNDIGYRAVWFGSGVSTVFEAGTILASFWSSVDIRPDADGGGGAGIFLEFDTSKGQIRRPGNPISQITGYGSGLQVIRGSHVRNSGNLLDISNSSGDGVLLAGHSELLTVGIISSTPGAAFGMRIFGASSLAGSVGCTISGASGNAFLGNTISGTIVTWASIPIADAVADPIELSNIRYTAGP